jgi:hypothetical protein
VNSAPKYRGLVDDFGIIVHVDVSVETLNQQPICKMCNKKATGIPNREAKERKRPHFFEREM